MVQLSVESFSEVLSLVVISSGGIGLSSGFEVLSGLLVSAGLLLFSVLDELSSGLLDVFSFLEEFLSILLADGDFHRD